LKEWLQIGGEGRVSHSGRKGRGDRGKNNTVTRQKATWSRTQREGRRGQKQKMGLKYPSRGKYKNGVAEGGEHEISKGACLRHDGEGGGIANDKTEKRKKKKRGSLEVVGKWGPNNVVGGVRILNGQGLEEKPYYKRLGEGGGTGPDQFGSLGRFGDDKTGMV